MTVPELEDEFSELRERVNLMEEKLLDKMQELEDDLVDAQDQVRELEARVPEEQLLSGLPILPEPRNDREFMLAYAVMHPTPGGEPRCTW